MKKIIFLITLLVMISACSNAGIKYGNNNNDVELVKQEDETINSDEDILIENQDDLINNDDNMEENKMTQVMFETNMGNFIVELNGEKAPISVENFLAYVNEGYYDGLIFHRIISNFMVQGGGFTPDMKQKETKAEIKNEADNGLKNDKYTIAMARTSVVDSATSQFFINVQDNDFLNHGGRDFGYAVFGKVVEGFDTIDKIKMVETGAQDVPKEPVIMTKVYVK